MRRRADGLGGLRGTIRQPSERITTMGLDMYLTKRNAAARDEQDEMVAYWRKANHIHGWFERNVAYGELENCELYPVSFEQLMSLGVTCQLVKANPESASALLAAARRASSSGAANTMTTTSWMLKTLSKSSAKSAMRSRTATSSSTTPGGRRLAASFCIALGYNHSIRDENTVPVG